MGTLTATGREKIPGFIIRPGTSGNPPGGKRWRLLAFYQQTLLAGSPRLPAGQTHRGEPDIAAEADPETGMYVCTDYSGCVHDRRHQPCLPLWAAMLDITDQYVVANGGAHLGFVNPAVYQSGKFRSTLSSLP